MSNAARDSIARERLQRPRNAVLAAAGLTLALISLLQHQWQRGQVAFESLVAEGEIVEDRLLAHIERLSIS